MLFNGECWLGLTLQQLRDLERVDEMMMARILKTPSYTSRAFLYLSLGLIPIRFLLAKQRLLFFHYILKEEETSLIYNILKATLEDPTKNDFGNQVRKDLDDLNIKLSIEEIKSMNKYSFKKLVKTEL